MHSRSAQFRTHVGGRRNGWQQHLLSFHGSVKESCSVAATDDSATNSVAIEVGSAAAASQNGALFTHDDLTGTITIIQDLRELKHTVWWQGHAPFGYKMICLFKNLDLGSVYADIDFTKMEEEWKSNVGHISKTLVNVKAGDRFNVVNWPAHIQGAPAAFSWDIIAFAAPTTAATATAIATPATDDTSASSEEQMLIFRNLVIKAITTGKLDEAVHILNDMDDATRIRTISPLRSDGEALAEYCRELTQSPEEAFELRNLCCINSIKHCSLDAIIKGTAGRSYNNLCQCCGASFSQETLDELESFRVENNAKDMAIAANYGEHLWKRGVTVGFLRSFSKDHHCLNWPTWRVCQYIVKTATDTLKCRFVELPESAEIHLQSNVVGDADIFLSHCWKGTWGTLVSAAAHHLDDHSRVWCDLFAVRQWPGSSSDLAFEEVVRRVKGLVLCITGIDEIGELNFVDVQMHGPAAIAKDAREKIPFLRVWCLVEILAAISEDIPTVLVCGNCLDHTDTFISNMPLLFIMQYLIDIEKAEATFQSDVQMVLDRIQVASSYDAVNRRVRGAVVGALTNASFPSISRAALGYPDELCSLLCTVPTTDPDSSACLAVFAAAGGGFDAELTQLLQWFPSGSNIKDIHGKSPLMYSAQGGHDKCIEILLKFGADPNVQCLFGFNVFCYGASCLTSDQVEFLIKSHAQPFSSHANPLMLAAQDGNLGMCEALLKVSNVVELMTSIDNIGYTPLRHAIAFGHLQVAELFLRNGANINATDNHGQSILYWAICSGKCRSKTISFLLTRGCNIDEKAMKVADDSTSDEAETFRKILKDHTQCQTLNTISTPIEEKKKNVKIV